MPAPHPSDVHPAAQAAAFPSRRTLTRGALWSAPVVALGAAAPAASASTLPCPATSCLVHNTVSVATWTVAVSSQIQGTCQDIFGTTLYNSGSRMELNLGSIYVDPACAPAGTTGFRISFTSVSATDQSGGTHVGTIVTNCAGCAYANGAGLGGALNLAAEFNDFSYFDNCSLQGWNASHHLVNYTIGYTVTYLNWLDPVNPLTQPCPFSSTVTASGDAVFGSWSLGSGMLTKIA